MADDDADYIPSLSAHDYALARVDRIIHRYQLDQFIKGKIMELPNNGLSISELSKHYALETAKKFKELVDKNGMLHINADSFKDLISLTYEKGMLDGMESSNAKFQKVMDNFKQTILKTIQ